MLKTIAQSKSIFEETEVGIPQKTEMTQAQRALVEKIKRAGGHITTDEATTISDQRTITALTRKGVIQMTKMDGQSWVSLCDLLVEPEMPHQDRSEMSAKAFCKLCDEIFGYGYQTHLSRVLGVNKATVGKWCQGKLAVPTYAIAFMKTLAHCKDIGAPLPDFVER